MRIKIVGPILEDEAYTGGMRWLHNIIRCVHASLHLFCPAIDAAGAMTTMPLSNMNAPQEEDACTRKQPTHGNDSTKMYAQMHACRRSRSLCVSPLPMVPRVACYLYRPKDIGTLDADCSRAAAGLFPD